MKRIFRFLPYFYFVICFSILYFLFSISLFQESNIIHQISNKKIIPRNNIENLISSVNSKDDLIHIKFKQYVQKEDVLSSFSLTTQWEDEKIYFPPNSAQIVQYSSKSNYDIENSNDNESDNSNQVTIRFLLPVVDIYNATLSCGTKSFILNLSITNFTSQAENTEKYSQLFCHGESYYGKRWCEATNLYIVDHVFFFYSKAEFKFPNPLLVPGARAPPFDKSTDRFGAEPLVTDIPFKAVPRSNKEYIKEIAVVDGVFYNYHMLWHLIFDLMIPLYSFLNVRHHIGAPETRRLFLRSDGFWVFSDIAKAITKYNPVVLDLRHNPMFLEYSVIGVEKLEKDPNPFRDQISDPIVFQYNFNRSTCPGFRDDLIKNNHIYVKETTKPLVLIISRGTSKRDIKNMDEIVAATKEILDFCDIEIAQLQDYNFKQQVQYVAPAQVLIGMHGSGLSHTIWMDPSVPERRTHLVEIIPYAYTCRNWYHTAADVAGVEYHSVMNKEPKMPEGKNQNYQDQLRSCWNADMCGTVYCHDLLRDQYVDTDMDVYNATIREIAETLKNQIKTS